MNNLVAVEIHNNSLRMVEVHNPKGKNPKIVKAHTMELPVSVAGESLINDSDSFATLLQEVWKTEGFRTKNVVLVISGRRFVVRQHVTSQSNLKIFKENIKYDTANVVPETMLNPIIDFYPTHYSKDKAHVKTHGLVIATPAEPIEDIIGAFIKAGLTISFVDFGPMCIARFLNKYTETKDYAVVNIREFSSDIIVVKNNIVRLVRVVTTGLPAEHKKRGKRVKEMSQSINEDTMIQQSPIEQLAREINLTILSQNDELETSFETLYVAGNRSRDEELSISLQPLLTEGLMIRPIDLSSVASKSKLKEEDLDMNFVSLCAGMRNIK